MDRLLGDHRPAFKGDGDGMGPAGGAQFLQDVADVEFHGALADTLNPGNFPVGFSGSYPGQDFEFLGREAGKHGLADIEVAAGNQVPDVFRFDPGGECLAA